METGKLYMRYSENGKPEVIFEPVNGTVFLTVGEIAQLLGCFTVKVTGNIKVVFKSEILREMDVCCHYKYSAPTRNTPNVREFYTILI